MDRDDLHKLEEECEQAIEKVVKKRLSESIPNRTFHLMAKAAVTVLEAVLERTQGSENVLVQPDLAQISSSLQSTLDQIAAVYEDFNRFWNSPACERTKNIPESGRELRGTSYAFVRTIRDSLYACRLPPPSDSAHRQQSVLVRWDKQRERPRKLSGCRRKDSSRELISRS